MKGNGIRHILVAPHHPRSIGQAERFVATFKQAMKASSFGRAPSSIIQQRLMRFLFRYRTTPSTMTGATPAELFLKRRVRTLIYLLIYLLRPSFEKRVWIKQALQENVSDGSRSVTEFNVNDRVVVENFYGKPKWLSGTVVKRSGPVNYKVNVDGKVMRRHLDQMQSSDRAISLSRHPLEESAVSDFSRALNVESLSEGLPNEPSAHADNVSEGMSPVQAEASEEFESPTTCSMTDRLIRRQYPTRQQYQRDRYGFGDPPNKGWMSVVYLLIGVGHFLYGIPCVKRITWGILICK